MFAVPGWNLSAPLATESEAPPAANGANNAKKRKRNNAKKGDGNAGNVTGENVADMWAQVVEGTKKSEKAAAGPNKGMKSQKQEFKAMMKAEQQKQQELERQQKKQDGDGAKHKSKKQRRESESDAKTPKAQDGQEGEKKEDAPVATSKEQQQASSKPEPKAKKQKNKNKNKQQNNNASDSTPTTAPSTAITAAPSPLPPANTKLTPLQAKMREKLVSARFRHLNQTLYTTPSAHSLQLIEDDPQIFNEYHAGFRAQVTTWPENPVDTFVELVKKRGAVRDSRKKPQWKGKNQGGEGGDDDDDDDEEQHQKQQQLKPLPRDFRSHVCTLADLGCGDAVLSSSLQPSLRKLKLAIHSFDLAAPSPLITKADIANLPLASGSVDVAIFCLALMGTNWPDFIDEAYRVLRWKGELWVAEIKSRFGRVASAKDKQRVVDHSVGKRQKKGAAAAANKKKDAEKEANQNEADLAVEVDGADSGRAETDVSAFVDALRARGFVLDGEPSQAVDLRNKMFVRMQFVKAAPPTKGKNVRKDGEEGRRDGGKGGATWKPKMKKSFIEDEGEDAVDEAGLLKPCVYKLR
ncbi:putative rRNA processing protein Rrp8 [Phyllosticta capitalensis]